MVMSEPVNSDTEKIYERAGMNNRIGYGDTPVLLVIDLQKGFTDPENPLGGDLTDVVNRTNRLLEAARTGNIPVVFTRILTSHETSDDFGIWNEKIPALETLAVESKWVELDERLQRRENDYLLDKRQASAFHETELNSMLGARGTDTIVVAGCTTSGCVRASALDACQHGYRAIVPEEAVGDRAIEPHEANLFDIDAKYGDVRPIEETIEYLEMTR